MEILLIVLCVVVFLLALVVFSPVVVAVNSRKRQVRLHWLHVLEFLMPLPGTGGDRRLYVFRRPVALRARGFAKLASKAPRKLKKRRVFGRFLMRCLSDSAIRHALARQVAKLLRRMPLCADVIGAASEVSLPDPALNGMLAGALAASGWGRRSGIRINFGGENSLFIELRFHPHRVIRACLYFLSGLPYRAMFKVWRALPAAPRQ